MIRLAKDLGDLAGVLLTADKTLDYSRIEDSGSKQALCVHQVSGKDAAEDDCHDCEGSSQRT